MHFSLFFSLKLNISFILVDGSSAVETEDLERADDPIESVIPSHTRRGTGRPRGAAAGSRQHKRSDAELGWAEFDHNPDMMFLVDTQVFQTYLN